jgi:hypothetical protein
MRADSEATRASRRVDDCPQHRFFLVAKLATRREPRLIAIVGHRGSPLYHVRMDTLLQQHRVVGYCPDRGVSTRSAGRRRRVVARRIVRAFLSYFMLSWAPHARCATARLFANEEAPARPDHHRRRLGRAQHRAISRRVHRPHRAATGQPRAREHRQRGRDHRHLLGLHLVALNVVYPKLMGGRMQLNPLVATISMLVWTVIWGALGLAGC